MRFSKEKMIERLVREGRANEIRPEDIEIMDTLDGEEVEEICWRNVVFGENVGYIEKHKMHINLDDCI